MQGEWPQLHVTQSYITGEERGRKYEEWLCLQPREKIEGARWMEKPGGWDTGGTGEGRGGGG